MNKILVLVCLAVMFTFFSCDVRYGSGKIVTVQKSLQRFTAVSVSGAIEAEFRTGPQKVVIEADDNLIEHIITEVDDRKLRISTGMKNLRDAHIKVFITAPDVNRLAVSGGGTIEIKDEIKAPDRLNLSATSAGEIEGRIDAPVVELNGSSGAELKITGRTRDLAVDGSSGSEIEALNLMAETTRVSVSSGARAEVHASISLRASASSGAEVKYLDGGQVSISQSSGGSVRRLN